MAKSFAEYIEIKEPGIHALMQSAEYWPVFEHADDDDDSEITLIRSIKKGAPNHALDLIEEMAKAITHGQSLTASTAYAHALGVLSSATMLNFDIAFYNKRIPLNLYVATAAPPGSGKSNAHDFFWQPIKDFYDRLRAENAKKSAKIKRRIAVLKKTLDSMEEESQGAAQGATAQEIAAKSAEKEELEREIRKIPVFLMGLTDITAEALPNNLITNGDLCVLTSSEATLLDSVIGAMYGRDGSPKNNEILLKGFGREYACIGRARGMIYEGYPCVTVAVIAQAKTLETLAKSGAVGNGLQHRFLVYRDDGKMPEKHDDSVNSRLERMHQKYKQLICNILSVDGKVTLRMSDEAWQLVRDYKASFDGAITRGGVYDNEIVKPMILKSDQFIIRLAALMHVTRHWQTRRDGDKSLIDNDLVERAIALNALFFKSFLRIAEQEGQTGLSAECRDFIEWVAWQQRKGKLFFTIPRLADNLIKRKIFAGQYKSNRKGFTAYIKSTLLPALESKNAIKINGKIVYTNPTIKNT